MPIDNEEMAVIFEEIADLLEIEDANPFRVRGGVLISINSDAHAQKDFHNLSYGINQARRGWLGKDDVLNTRPLKTLSK